MSVILRKTPIRSGATLQELKRDSLQQFLTKHGFDDVKHPRQLGKLTARVKMQCVYPIHVAADIGDDEALRMLLEEGADPEEGDDQGRTAMDIAQEANVDGSHVHVLGLLQRAIQVNMASF